MMEHFWRRFLLEKHQPKIHQRAQVGRKADNTVLLVSDNCQPDSKLRLTIKRVYSIVFFSFRNAHTVRKLYLCYVTLEGGAGSRQMGSMHEAHLFSG